MSIVVIAEQVDGDIRKGSLQAIGQGATLSGGEFRCIVLGSDAAKAAAQAGAAGAAKIEFLTCATPADWNAESVAARVAEAAKGSTLVLLSASDFGADLAPRLATLLGGACLSDVTGISKDGAKHIFHRPIYAGKAQEKVELLASSAVVTLRANAFPTPAANGTAQVVELGAKQPANLKSLVKDIIAKAGEGNVSLTEADIIVSGGIGVGGPEGYAPLKELCKVLGAALGASRAAVHAGWIDPDHQVGQTGKTVSPSLYIACGISGAIQHQAGMRTSKCIVAINKDPNAPIFQIAHYGIVGDVHEVVPALTREFKAALGR